ncbi:hypothetical protein ABXJ14_12400 [Morganella morganii]|uniref:hypothetical protein n=1 Tax=Morganella morganii TaxID=582 RepID=UPI00339BD291
MSVKPVAIQTEKVIEAIELLSRLFTDDRMEMLEEVRQMDMLAQADIFDLWFDIIKSREYASVFYLWI